MSLDQVASPETSGVDGGIMDFKYVWPGVALVGIVIGAVTLLSALGRDTTTLVSVISTLVLPLLAALLYGKLKGIEEKTEQVNRNTNGNMSEIFKQYVESNQRAIELLARSQPIPEPTNGDSALTEKTVEIKSL